MSFAQRLRYQNAHDEAPNHFEQQLKDAETRQKILDINIAMVRKFLEAAKDVQKDLRELGVPEDQAGLMALELVENIGESYGGGGH